MVDRYAIICRIKIIFNFPVWSTGAVVSGHVYRFQPDVILGCATVVFYENTLETNKPTSVILDIQNQHIKSNN